MPYPKLETAYRHIFSNGLFLYQASLSTLYNARFSPLLYTSQSTAIWSETDPSDRSHRLDLEPIERKQALLSRPHHPQILSVLRLNPAYSFSAGQFYLNIIFRRSTRPVACDNLLGFDGGVKVWPQISGGMVKNTVLHEWARQHGLRGCTTTDI